VIIFNKHNSRNKHNKHKNHNSRNNHKNHWLITAALPYSNNIPHIGNIVGSHLPADIFARFLRLFGEDVVFVGGTDEHGSPIEVAAFKAGLTPKVLTDKLYVVHKKIYEWFGISYDNFSRTSHPIHHQLFQQIFLKLLHNGYITKHKILLPYTSHNKRFLPDRWVEGKCPICGYEHARGDQCENCGNLLDPEQLINPKSVIDGSTPQFKEVEHLFLDLPKFSQQLEKWIKGNKQLNKTTKNLSLGWLKKGLKERCITRDLEWGIRVPLDPYKDKVIYVWAESVWGYVSATIEWAEKVGRPDEWRKYWQDKDSRIVHFLGKDNVPFHTLIWPAEIMGAGGFNLPYDVVGLEFLNYEKDKISKSRNWGIFLDYDGKSDKVLVIHRDRTVDVDADYLRFYLTRIMPETKDADFVWKEFERKINAELIGNFGNFVFRTLSFVRSNFNQTIPEPDTLKVKDMNLLKKITATKKKIKKLILGKKFRDALAAALELSSAGNKYFQDKKPWETLKKNPEDCRNTLYVAANLVRALAVCFSPFVPFACERLWRQLNLEGTAATSEWETIDKIHLKPLHRIGKIEPLFRKFEAELSMKG